MLKRFKKIIIALLVIITLFEFVYTTNISYGVTAIELLNGATNLAGGIVSILLWRQRITITAITMGLDIITTILVKDFGVTDSKYENLLINPYAIFFNKYKLLDINFFKISDADNEGIRKMREGIAAWYHVVQAISASAMLAVLIYVGIRMALSTLAEDKAKYKKMLADWVVGVVLLFSMHWIIIATVYANDAIVESLEAMFRGLEDETSHLAISYLVENLAIMSVLSVGLVSFSAMMVFVMVVFQTIMFLLGYITRMIKLAFLIIISPLIVITYAIDRMGDGKAQAFNAWLKEYVFTILIQPFHCIIYFAFGSVAMKLLITGMAGDSYSIHNIGDVIIGNLTSLFTADVAMDKLSMGIFAVLSLKFINDAEQIVRHIFHFEDDSKGSLAVGAAITMGAIANAQKIGSAARKGINEFGTNISDIRRDTSTRMNKVQGILKGSENGLARGIGGLMEKGREGAEKVSEGISNSKFSQFIGNSSNTVKRKISGVRQFNEKFKRKLNNSGRIGQWMLRKNSLSHALGSMAFMASMASGSGVIESLGKGAAFEKAGNELFPTSNNNLATSQEDYLEEIEQAAYDKIGDEIESTTKEFEEVDDKLTEMGVAQNDDNYEAHQNKANELEKEASELEEEANQTFTSEDAKKLAEYEKTLQETGKLQTEAANEEYKELLKKQANAQVRRQEAAKKRLEIDKEKEIAGLMEKRKTFRDKISLLSKQKEEFFTNPDAIKARMINYRSGASAKELKAAAHEVMQLIIEAKHRKDEKLGPESMDHDIELDDDEVEDINNTQEYIKKALSDATIMHSGVDFDDIISRSTDLDPSDSMYEDLKAALVRYFTEMKKDELASAWEKSAQYSGDPDAMDDAMITILMSKIKGNKFRL